MPSKRVAILDTSLLCVWLKVPGKETCGSGQNCWDWNRVENEIQQELEEHAMLCLPLATIIETGNHITHAAQFRHQKATELAALMRKAADAESPWAAFTDQTSLWSSENLKKLAGEWPPLAARGLALGDSTIKGIADYYSKIGCRVRLLTGDQKLSSYEPQPPSLVPRRRRAN